MSDPFSLLGLERRPLLGEEEIGSAYRKLAGALHPDQAGGDTAAFRALGEAASILRDPARRLKELAGGEAGKNSRQPPHQAAALFQHIAEILQRADSITTRHAAASNVLAKSLLAAHLKALEIDLKAVLSRLQAWKASLDQELLEIDRCWPEHDPEALLGVASSFAYAGRWETQLRERELAIKACFLNGGFLS